MALQPSQSHPSNLQPGDTLVVIHDFDARSGDELTLRRSERVELIELDDGFSDGWFLGKHLTRGGTGLFPGVYTIRAPATLKTPPHSRNASAYVEATTNQPIPKPSPGITLPSEQPRPVSTPQHSVSALSDPNPDYTRSSLPAPHHSNYVQRTIGEALGDNDRGKDSPVMNETLNSIDEHITNLSTPRQNQAYRRHRSDSESEYSAHLDRASFVNGPGTDEEDNYGLEESTVRSWDQYQTAQYLQNIGLDPAHCQIFKEQEITGDVLLDMDQNFLYMKEYDFGVMGRRLKTWHKVRDFQNDVKAISSRRTSDRGQQSSREGDDASARQNLSGHTSTGRAQDRSLSLRQALQTPPVGEESGDVPYPLQPQQVSNRASWSAHTPPTSWRATVGSDSPTITSNQSAGKSRRHSSIDFGTHPDLELSSPPSASSHQKQSSWSLAGSTVATTPASSIRPSAQIDDNNDLPAVTAPSPLDIDRGYFSSNDMESRKARNRLSKGPRIGHSRQTSMAETSNRTSMIKRHARLSSAGSIQEQPGARPTGASRAYHEIPAAGRMRSASARVTSPAMSSGGLSPAVTNLENDSVSNVSSPVLEKMRMQDRARKLMGFRAASDSVATGGESNNARFTPILDNQQSDFVASPTTGDTTPSATPSIDMETPDESIKGNDTPSLSKPALRPRPRTKQYTSAYTHGLLKIPPSEARKQCDHHGWMKKKSSGIMTTWKPRLFILRGRRLSYYYSENDTEERGIIDISSHKVLVANDDPMVTIHSSITGATKSSSTPKMEGETSPSIKSPNMVVFYFKLVPPKSGLSRAVQFTKPQIHYFQVDTIAEGRKWMGEIMKATIEHDLASFQTTNKQKTISLAKARNRRERPPELTDTKKVEPEKAEDSEKMLQESGLKIQGLEYANTDMSNAIPENPAAPKAMSTLGLGPRVSLTKRKDELDSTILEEDDKENMADPPATTTIASPEPNT